MRGIECEEGGVFIDGRMWDDMPGIVRIDGGIGLPRDKRHA